MNIIEKELNTLGEFTRHKREEDLDLKLNVVLCHNTIYIYVYSVTLSVFLFVKNWNFEVERYLYRPV